MTNNEIFVSSVRSAGGVAGVFEYDGTIAMRKSHAVQPITFLILTALGCAAAQKQSESRDASSISMSCAADECMQRMGLESAPQPIKRTPGAKSTDVRQAQEGEAQYARAVNLIRGIDQRVDPVEVTTLLESACGAGVASACDDLEGKNLIAPQLSAGEPIRPTRDAVAAMLEGLMVVKCRLPPEGILKECRIIKSLPFHMEDTVLKAISTWRYRPAIYNGQQVEVGLAIVLHIRTISTIQSP